MPAVLTFSEDGTAVSFTMPEMPSGGRPRQRVRHVSGDQARRTSLRFDYAAGTGPQARVAADATVGVVPSSSSGTSWPLLFAAAMGALVAGWVAFVVAMHRRIARTS